MNLERCPYYGSPISVLRFGDSFEISCDACGAGWEMVTRLEDRKGHDRRYSLDDTALRALGYAPRTGFAAGLAATVQWYRENRRWWEPLKRSCSGPGSGRDDSAGGPAARTTGCVGAGAGLGAGVADGAGAGAVPARIAAT